MTIKICLLFSSFAAQPTERDKIDAINLMVYCFNSVIMLIDLMTVTHPIILSHTYWTMAIGIIYTIFTVVYYIGGGTTRYVKIDTQKSKCRQKNDDFDCRFFFSFLYFSGRKRNQFIDCWTGGSRAKRLSLVWVVYFVWLLSICLFISCTVFVYVYLKSFVCVSVSSIDTL